MLPPNRLYHFLGVFAATLILAPFVFTGSSSGSGETTLEPLEDAYVRNRASAGDNFGSSSSLTTRTKPNDKDLRWAYLKFDLSSIDGRVTRATLRLYGAMKGSSSSEIPVAAHAVADTSWTESNINWSNKPTAAPTPLATVVVSGAAPRYYEWDLTSYLQQAKQAGQGSVSMVLSNAEATASYVRWNSREAADDWPQLVITTAAALPVSRMDTITFHGDRQRLGWNPNESVLTPASVSSGRFGPVWDSPQFDSVVVEGRTYAPHLYASPLYVDDVLLTGGSFSGLRFSVVFAASSNGFVYAVNAFPTSGPNPVQPGRILWRKRLGTPAMSSSLDGVPLGILSTPIIDLHTAPPRMYVTCADAVAGWQVFALDITNGNVLAGWPVEIDDAVLAPINGNGPAEFRDAKDMSQRAALNLNAEGSLLYVSFGSHIDGGAGWMVVVDAVSPRVLSGFSGAASSARIANAGMWGAGGPSIDAGGRVYITTGNSTAQSPGATGVWGQSLLVWRPGPALQLAGTYTPFNHCQLDEMDIDLGGGSPIIIPDLDPATTSTPHLAAFGGKQGNIYLVDRDNLPGRTDSRPPCSADSAMDRSLLPPQIQPQFGARGPLNVFGPYSDTYGNADRAKMRSTPAYFRGPDGSHYVFLSGSTKAAVDSTIAVPPCLVRLRIVTAPRTPAYLAIDGAENSLVFLNPGSPGVTSNASKEAIVWVLDANIPRLFALAGSDVPHPVLYAVDAGTLKPLWRSTPNQLMVGGKYSTPAISGGVVFVGTDRIQAFGLK